MREKERKKTYEINLFWIYFEEEKANRFRWKCCCRYEFDDITSFIMIVISDARSPSLFELMNATHRHTHADTRSRNNKIVIIIIYNKCDQWMQVCSMSCVDRVNFSHTVGEFALNRTLVCAITIYAVISFGACTQTRDVFECVSTAAICIYMCRRLRMQKISRKNSRRKKKKKQNYP